MNDWRVSVIVPVYCGEKFIAEALRSIVAQTVAIHQIIVIDDGSTDGTRDVVQSFRADIEYVFQDNHGPQHARNRGLEIVQGDAIAFLDADDRWLPNKLALQIPRLSEADVVMGHSLIMDAADGAPFVLPSLCCALFRKSAFDKVGTFDPELEYSDDMDWYLRAHEDGLHIELHEDVVLEHRRHDSNLTRDSKKKERFHLLMLHKSIVRRRKKGIVGAPQLSGLFGPLSGNLS